MNTGLYLQPSPFRNNDASLPTAPDEGVDVYSLINELTNRIDQATKKLEQKVDNNALAKILLTDRDLVLMGDQVSVVGQLNIVDWIRDVSGNPTGGIDPSSMTRITGGKVQTGVIESFNWSTSAGSQFDLDNGTIVLGGTSSPKFSVSSAGVMTCVDAVVTGTLQAGSIIAGSVKLNNSSGMSLDSLAAGANVQSALSAGVTNILAGIGSNFRLDVAASNAFVALRHKDAVFLGTAAPGSVKPALGISATGIGIGYNRASDGAWVTSITLDSSGNAAFAGTISAGSIIAGSVKLNNSSGMSLDSLAAGANVQSALSAGVTNILAGIGSNFRLDVAASNAFVALRHKDAVFLGTAAPGSVKPALGISATGIGIGYNRASDGAWITSITLDSSGNAAFAGTISAGSVITGSVTVGGVALSTISSNASSGKSISDALLVSGTTVLKGVLVPTDAGAIKTGTITWNATTGALTGGTGVAVTEWGIIGANAGTATFTLAASTGAATFRGDITGGSNLDITGRGVFGGAYTTSGYNSAIHGNAGFAALNGVTGYSNSALGAGVRGQQSGNGQGVNGFCSSAGGYGVWAENNAGGVALQVVGKMTINNSTLVTNLNAQKWNGFTAGTVTTGSATATVNLTNKPGANSTNSWWVVSDGTTTLRIMCWIT